MLPVVLEPPHRWRAVGHRVEATTHLLQPAHQELGPVLVDDVVVEVLVVDRGHVGGRTVFRVVRPGIPMDAAMELKPSALKTPRPQPSSSTSAAQPSAARKRVHGQGLCQSLTTCVRGAQVKGRSPVYDISRLSFEMV